MTKLETFFDVIKRKLGLRNKSQDRVITLNIVLQEDISNLYIEIPIDKEDNLHDK